MFGIVILAVYAVLMIGVTLMFTRKTTDAEGFHVADRRIGSAIAAMSIAATWIWAPSLFTSSEMAYTRGIPGMFWFTVPNVLCLILFIPFAKRIRAQYPEGITLTGYMAERYHSGKVKGVYSFQLGALAVLSTAVQLLAGGKTLALITGLPFWSMTLALAAIAYSYSRFSGLKASIITDVVQLGIILMGGALLVVLSLRMTGGFDAVRAGLGAVSGEYTSLTSSTGIEVLLGYGLPMAVGLISGPFGDQCFWQRAFAIRRDRIGRSFFAGALLFALVPICMGTVGFLAAGSGFVASDTGMVNFEFVSSLLPTWVLVPFLFMIISGLLSTVDSNLCAAASLTTDWLGIGKDTVQTSRRTMLCLLIVAIAIANIPGLTVTYLFLFYGTLRASTLLPTVMTLLGKKLTGKGVIQPQLHGIEPGQHLGISGKPLPHGSGILGKDPRGGPYDHFAGTQPQFPLHTGKQRHGQRHQRDGGQQVEDIGARSDPGEQAKYQRRSAQRREHLTGRIAQGGQRHGIQPGKPLFEAREHQPGIRPRTGGNIVDDGLDVVGAAIRA